MQVNAGVLPHVQIEFLSGPDSLQITENDVARGYVDVPMPMSLAVTSNLPGGLMLEFALNNRQVERTNVKGLVSAIQLPSSGGGVLLPWKAHVQRLALSFRFFLTASATPGTYPWPLRVAAAP